VLASSAAKSQVCGEVFSLKYISHHRVNKSLQFGLEL
jgi:hypothetical protein